MSDTAPWNMVDSAIEALRRQLSQPTGELKVIAMTLEQLDTALSALCTPTASSSQTTAAPPSGPVKPSDNRPDASELALRERLTMRTHRPAEPAEISSAAQHDQACEKAFTAAAKVRMSLPQGRDAGDSDLRKLEEALANLRKIRP
jgi:hypothetical protein